MIESTSIQGIAGTGDRVEVETGNGKWQAIVKELQPAGVVLVWHEIAFEKINSQWREGMIECVCFIANEEIKSFMKIL